MALPNGWTWTEFQDELIRLHFHQCGDASWTGLVTALGEELALYAVKHPRVACRDRTKGTTSRRTSIGDFRFYWLR